MAQFYQAATSADPYCVLETVLGYRGDLVPALRELLFQRQRHVNKAHVNVHKEIRGRSVCSSCRTAQLVTGTKP